MRAVQEEVGRTLAASACNTAARLAGRQDRYEIKRCAGYRLAYEVRDTVLLVILVAAGKRERNAVYRVATKRWRRSAFEDSASVVSSAFVRGERPESAELERQ